MWTSTIQQKIKGSESMQVDVEFSDGKDSFEVAYFVRSLEQLKSLVSTKLDNLNTIDLADTEILIGSFDPSIIPKPPTQDEVDFLDFLKSYRELKGMERAIETGIKKASDLDYIALQVEVKGKYKPEYAEKI